ncbi:Ku protein [Streptomyces coerulescens]|uniref:Ku protein n=1 Tax=Streptomyces coerulescens TaxID=29304 RepID=A0ABW0CX15_STRCD
MVGHGTRVLAGVITFGMVSVPVGLFTATEDQTAHFHQLQRGTADRIRNRRVNEGTGNGAAGKDIVVEPDEVDEIARDAPRPSTSVRALGPGRYRDTYQDGVRDLVKAKAEG